MSEKKKVPYFIRIFYVGAVASLVVWVIVLAVTQGYFERNMFTGYEKVETFHEEWVDEAGNEIIIPADYEVPEGEDMRIFHTVGESFDMAKSILFRTDHTYVRAYVNGKEVYRFGTAEEIPIGKTPGSGWQLIQLGELQAGDVIMLELNCPYEKYSGLLRTILIGEKAELVSYILWKGMGKLLLTIIPVLIGIAVMVFPPVFFREYQAHGFFNIGLTFVIISAWSFTEARTWQLFFVNAYAMQILNFLTFAMFVPSVVVTLRILGFIPQTKLYNIVLTVDIVIDLIVVVLQVFNIEDFFNTLTIVHLMIILNAFIFVTSFRNLKKKQGMMRWFTIGLYAIIVMSAVLDLMDFYVWDYFGNGFFTRIEILALLIYTGLMSTKRALLLHNQNIEKLAYEKMAYTDTMTSLRNRRSLNEAIDTIERQKKSVTIMYADMNGLKYINDNIGHHAGDDALILVSQELKQLCGEDTFSYRIGGDEFCVLSFSMKPEALENCCIRINQKLMEYESKYQYPIGISYGVVKHIPKEGVTIQQSLLEADRKMYQNKEELYRHRSRYR